MSLFRHPVRVKYIRVLRLYRATYRDCAAYGRNPKEAVNRVRARYEDERFRLGDVFNAIGWSLIPPYH